MARAVRIRGAGGVDVLQLEEFDAPKPGPDEIAVEIKAAGLNRADCLQRRGFYPAPPGTVADIPGLEFAGEVRELGSRVGRWKVGDRVMGICAGGAMATALTAHERMVVPIPDGMSFEDAAAVPEVFFTAFDALFHQGALRYGESVLIHAVGSGVGTAALQLARHAGARVIGTSRTQGKLDKAAELGLQEAICVTDKVFAKETRSRTGGVGADLILDFVGAAYLGENIKALASKGRLVVIGLLGGVSGELPLGLLLAKRATIVGTVLRSRPLEEKIALTQAFDKQVVPALAAGSLRPIVDTVMPMEEVGAAHELLESNNSFGKIVLRW